VDAKSKDPVASITVNEYRKAFLFCGIRR